MGIFSQNYRPGFNDNYVVEAAEGYGGPGAAAKIMIECQQNDMALFKGLISSDFHAAYAAANGSVTESTLITEGAIGDFFKKVKEMFLKLIEKIKGLIKSFITKFVATFIRDGKELVKKYSKQVKSNLNNSKMKMKEMTFKIHEGIWSSIEEKNDAFEVKFKPDNLLFSKLSNSINKKIGDPDKQEEDLKKDMIGMLNSEYKIQCSEINDLKSELTEKFIGSIDEQEGYTSSLNSFIEELLKGGSKVIRDLERDQRKAEDLCKKNIKAAETAMKSADNIDYEKDSYKTGTKIGDNEIVIKNKSNAQNYTSILYKAATIDQEVITTLTSFDLEYWKTILKDVRSIYIKAASRRAVTKEDAILFDIIDEANAYEVDMMFDCPISESFSDEELMEMINQ